MKICYVSNSFSLCPRHERTSSPLSLHVVHEILIAYYYETHVMKVSICSLMQRIALCIVLGYHELVHVVKKCLKHLTYNCIFHKQVCCFSTTNIQGHRKETVRHREDRGLHFLFSFWPLLKSNVNMGGGLSKDVLESKVRRVLCSSYFITLFLLVGTL